MESSIFKKKKEILKSWKKYGSYKFEYKGLSNPAAWEQNRILKIYWKIKEELKNFIDNDYFTKDELIEIVAQDWKILAFIKKQDQDICWEAVKQNSRALNLVDVSLEAECKRNLYQWYRDNERLYM